MEASDYSNELYSDERLLDQNGITWVQSIMGSLQYYAKETRDDIAAPVNIIAQRMHNPTEGTKKSIKRVLAYLAGTVNRKLSVPRVKGTQWKFYSDSDHAGGRNSGDTKSRTGIMLLCNGMQFHWRSNKQPVASYGSACAEMYAISECCREVRLIAWVAEEMYFMLINLQGHSYQHSTCAASKLRGVYDQRKGRVPGTRVKGPIYCDSSQS